MKSVYGKYLKKVALIWAGCFVPLFFVYTLMLSPQKNSKEQFEKQLAEKKQICESALKAAQKETKIQFNEQIEQLRSKLKNFVTDFEDSANLTFDISQIANKKEVTSFSIETKNNSSGKTAASDKHISESHIDISFLAASFNQFAALLNTLERHQPVIFVDQFTITRSDKDNSEHQVKMDLAVFVRKKQDS
ncbi:MAG: GspMb/PilO family protein [Sedimentisphaerales bacterium]